MIMKRTTKLLLAIGLIGGIVSPLFAGGMACPLFELVRFRDGTALYYSDFYPTSCADQPLATVMMGFYATPADCWEGECESINSGAFLAAADAPGLTDRVAATYVHDTGEFGAKYCRVSSEPSFDFIEFTLSDGDLVQHVVAKISTVEVTRPRRAGQPPKTRLAYVAFESVGRSRGSLPVRVKQGELRRLDNYKHGYVATVEHPTRKKVVQVLVLTEARPTD